MATIKLTNNTDRDMATRGLITPADVRTVELEGLVDTGATCLVLPADAVAALGLSSLGTRKARMADGSVHTFDWVGGVLLEILGREMTCDALVAPAGTQALIGQIPLENLDLLVDPKSREVRVNPESPDTPLLDLLAAS
jgi:clan AA aspartic protease